MVQAWAASLAAPLLTTTGLGEGGLPQVFVHKNVATLLQCQYDPGAWQGHTHGDSLHTGLTLSPDLVSAPLVLLPGAR